MARLKACENVMMGGWALELSMEPSTHFCLNQVLHVTGVHTTAWNPLHISVLGNQVLCVTGVQTTAWNP